MNCDDNISNTKILKSLRVLESFYIKEFKHCENIKRLYFKNDPKIWNRLKDFIENSDTEYLTYILKKGFRVNPSQIKELAKNDKIDELFDTFLLPSNILKKVVNMKSFDALIDEEKFYINQIIIMHYPMVISIANKSIKKSSFLSTHFNEIYNEGIFGIIHTLHKFELDKNVKFITYAFKWIQYYIHRYINSLIKDINIVNGNHKMHLFDKNAIYSYEEYIEALANCPINFIAEFSDIDFIKEENIYKSLNKIINYNKTRKHLLHISKRVKDDEILKLFNIKIEDKLLCKLILERLLKLKETNITKHSKYDPHYSLEKCSINEEHEKFENRATIEKLLKEAQLSPKEKDDIYNYLEKGDVNFSKINNIIKKIQKQISKNEKYDFNLI